MAGNLEACDIQILLNDSGDCKKKIEYVNLVMKHDSEAQIISHWFKRILAVQLLDLEFRSFNFSTKIITLHRFSIETIELQLFINKEETIFLGLEVFWCIHIWWK